MYINKNVIEIFFPFFYFSRSFKNVFATYPDAYVAKTFRNDGEKWKKEGYMHIPYFFFDRDIGWMRFEVERILNGSIRRVMISMWSWYMSRVKLLLPCC